MEHLESAIGHSTTTTPSRAFVVRTLDVPRTSSIGVELLFVTFIFSATLDEPAFAALSDDERDNAARFVRPEDAIRYAATRVVLRHALAKRTGLLAGELRFRRDAAGRPRLASTKGEEHALLDFNISHSGQHALIAVAANRRVGVDIEAHRTDLDWQTLANFVLGPRDKAHIVTMPADLRANAFYDVWTGKEALLKALGVGIGGGMTWFSILGGKPGEPLVDVIDKRVRAGSGIANLDAVWLNVSYGYSACVAWSRDVPKGRLDRRV